MRWIAVGLALLLAGCLDDQKKRLAQCQIDGLKIDPHAVSEQHSRHMWLCMKAGGYEYETSSPRCQVAIDWYAAVTNTPPRVSMASPTKLHCYRPMNWFARLTYPLEARMSDPKTD